MPMLKKFINRTSVTIYCVDLNGDILISDPEIESNGEDDNISNLRYNSITIVSVAKKGYYETHYTAPLPMMPTTIPAFGVVAFASEDEMERAIDKYGDPRRTARMYLLDEMALISSNAVWRSYTNLSESDYYTIIGKNVVKIPRFDDVIRKSYKKRRIGIEQQFSKQELEKFDIILVATSVGDTKDKHLLGDVKEMTTIKIPKKLESPDKPVFHSPTGIVIFPSQASAYAFSEKWKNYGHFYMSEMLSEAKVLYEDQFKDYKKKEKKVRGSIVKLFATITGTTVLNFGLEKTLKAITKKDEIGTIVRASKLMTKSMVGKNLGGFVAKSVGLAFIPNSIKGFLLRKVIGIPF